MREVSHYTATFKESVIAKALTLDTLDLVKLAAEVNIPYSTLYSWVRGKMHKKQKRQEGSLALRPSERQAEAKLRAIMETMDKTEAECHEYCRKNGYYPHQLEAWKQQMLEELAAPHAKKSKAESIKLSNEIKQLERELKRKDKALAEVSALLVLKKKPTYSGEWKRTSNFC